MKSSPSGSQPKPLSVTPASPGSKLPITIRLKQPTDSISEMTQLLHRAYRPQVEMGLAPLAGRQGDDITADRAAHSECWLAVTPREPGSLPKSLSGFVFDPDQPFARLGPDRILGIMLFEEVEKVTFPDFFLQPHVAHFAQFGVDPDCQGMGIGRLLLDKVEQRARENKADELALSMAEPDKNLFDFYIKRGFRLVDYWQWPYTNYRSCILSKKL